MDLNFQHLLKILSAALGGKGSVIVAGHARYQIPGGRRFLDAKGTSMLGCDSEVPCGHMRSMSSPSVVLKSIVLQFNSNS